MKKANFNWERFQKPVFKGKVPKKRRSLGFSFSLYKYNAFRRQKQELLKPKKGRWVWKSFEGVP